MFDRQSFFLIPSSPDEIDQGQSCAVVITVDCGFVCENRRRRNPARRITDLFAQVRALQFFTNAFKGEEEKRFVLLDWTTNRRAILFTIKTFKRIYRRKCSRSELRGAGNKIRCRERRLCLTS